MSHTPATPMSSIETAHMNPINASARMRLRPSPSFAIGSCASTMTIEFSIQRRPISCSLTSATFFAYGGISSTITAIPIVMKAALRTT